MQKAELKAKFKAMHNQVLVLLAVVMRVVLMSKQVDLAVIVLVVAPHRLPWEVWWVGTAGQLWQHMGCTRAFVKCVEAGDINQVKTLIAGKQISINAPFANGHNAMSYVLYYPQQFKGQAKELIQVLLNAGADPDYVVNIQARCTFGQTNY